MSFPQENYFHSNGTRIGNEILGFLPHCTNGLVL